MTTPLSFLIPVYNVQDFLEACLESVMNATIALDEIILLNDGSQDGSGRICDRWSKKYPDIIRVIHQKNQGLSASRNTAFQESKHDYICFLDSDDILCGDTIPFVRSLLSEKKPDLLTCDALLWEREKPLTRISHTLPVDALISGGDALEQTFIDDFLSSCCRIYHRNVLESYVPNIFPVGRSYEDNCIIPLIVSDAKRIAYLPMPLFRYRIRPGSITQQQTFKRCLDQATSLATPLAEISQLRADTRLNELANALAFSHVVAAVRHASEIPKVTLTQFNQIITDGMQTLTLHGDELANAVARYPNKKGLQRHAKGITKYPLIYATLRLLSARLKQSRSSIFKRKR